MYTPHTVTLYNMAINPATGNETYNVTILEGVFLDIAKGANIQKSGLEDADTATLFIPFSVNATEGSPPPETEPAEKTYMPPKRYNALSLADRANYWTLEPGGENSGTQCFFVKGINISSEGYEAMRNSMDFVFDVTHVDIRDFGSEDMRHWQVSAR